MMGTGGTLLSGNESTRSNGRFDIVHTNALRFFSDLVVQIGGNPQLLLTRAGIDPKVLGKRSFILEYRLMVDLLEIAASTLNCLDFGLKLAALQGGTRVMGPIGIAMKNSKTLGQALGYCAKQIQAYSLATRVRFVPDRTKHEVFVGFEILLHNPAHRTQIVEHALLLANLNILEITGGKACVRQVLFNHNPISALSVYQAAFGCEVLFGAPVDGMMLTEADLVCPVIEPDDELYDMATSFIESRYPPGTPPVHSRVRALIAQFLSAKDCSKERIAAELCMHPRTLQRRLKCDETTFETIKDEVRRDTAMRYLLRHDISLTQVAEKLGYAEQSVLSRSCFRWFSASPTTVRERAAISGSVTSLPEMNTGFRTSLTSIK